ncbi:hypothetical protein ACFY9H_03295 [Streptomyces bacillaris]|uniref:Uncharacterized protein n=1 Tax=Streptomyces cavourensis TaxID=67258 RepID=A0AAD0VG26_9ACTN|nr:MULTISPECIES: hypothetical protein [Streptomyces]NUW23310.1 hypothetical protein [Streptomyces roseoviolaceus]ATY97650.1 hypothetical protein CVT27_21025 [Streptomyces cavourensis]AXI73474.1 hypothetical protein DTW94_21065 [Streptomyces cavourensis]NUV88865.1 hypothetical protein [Streptomyces sp. KAI-26]TQO32329.1 hypothetical protein FHX79_114206 [Streptomyces cavourensis]
MPTPERAERPPRQQPTPSDLSMKDLLASCAAATAVSTPPPSEPGAAAGGADGDAETGHGSAVRRRAA